jgi:hemerythrin-like domain-containing protein
MTAIAPERREGMRVVSPSDPIEFILAEHLKHRQMCKALERLAHATDFDPAEIAALVDFIRFDLTLHVIDEEEDLFPLLRQRCEPEDGIERVLDRMTAEHAEDKALAVQVRDILNAGLIERKPPAAVEGAAEVLLAFAAHEKSHLVLENAVLVPLARRRFSKDDLGALGQRLMARRRWLAAPGD